MNIHEAVLLPLMIKEIFNIQISACQVINREQACSSGTRPSEDSEVTERAKEPVLRIDACNR